MALKGLKNAHFTNFSDGNLKKFENQKFKKKRSILALFNKYLQLPNLLLIFFRMKKTSNPQPHWPQKPTLFLYLSTTDEVSWDFLASKVCPTSKD